MPAARRVRLLTTYLSPCLKAMSWREEMRLWQQCVKSHLHLLEVKMMRKNSNYQENKWKSNQKWRAGVLKRTPEKCRDRKANKGMELEELKHTSHKKEKPDKEEKWCIWNIGHKTLVQPATNEEFAPSKNRRQKKESKAQGVGAYVINETEYLRVLPGTLFSKSTLTSWRCPKKSSNIHQELSNETTGDCYAIYPLSTLVPLQTHRKKARLIQFYTSMNSESSAIKLPPYHIPSRTNTQIEIT